MSSSDENAKQQSGGQMSFLEHLDELRRRIVNSVIILTIAFFVCWYFSGQIYNFLSVPVRRAIADAERRKEEVKGVRPLSELKEGEKGRYIFERKTELGNALVVPGASVEAEVKRDDQGNMGLFTDEPIFAGNTVVPKGVRLPVDFSTVPTADGLSDERMVVTTAMEPFTLYMTVSLYSAIALSIPLLLWQIWGFISPALYKHERKYVTPFVGLSTISFVIGAAFAYYVLFPPAANYLLGLGGDFQLMLRASDYLDFIILIMLVMGLIFQMPAITYVLARIGIVTAGFMARSWKAALVIILIVAAVASPTSDIPNMMLFAAPMMALYVVSIFIAWFFAKKRVNADEI